jgi:hypothetical protein
MPLPKCKCWFCKNQHLHKHSLPVTWNEVTGHLLVAESLDPNDVVRLEACHLCGHTRLKES